MKIIIPIIFTMIAVGLMAAALYFSKYKKGKSGCCGGGDICIDQTAKTCDEDNSKICICD